MQLHFGFDALPALRRPVVTVGSFDGVHRGHRALLATVKESACRCGGERVVVTFEPHPRIVLGRAEGLRLLTTLDEKRLLLEHCGIDHLVVIPFDRAFSELSYTDFVGRYLLGRLGMAELVVGYNHRFGHNQEGAYATLGDLSRRAGFCVTEVAECNVEREKVSSTVLRGIVARGEMEHAARMLGHPYLLLARSEGGAALRVDDPFKLLPCAGRYAVRTEGGPLTLTIGDRGELTAGRPLPAGPIAITFTP